MALWDLRVQVNPWLLFVSCLSWAFTCFHEFHGDSWIVWLVLWCVMYYFMSFHVISRDWMFFDVILWCYFMYISFVFRHPFFIKGEAMGGVLTWKCFSYVLPLPGNEGFHLSHQTGKERENHQTCRLSGDMLVPRRVSLCVGWVVSAKPVWKILFRKGRKDGRIIYCKSEWNGWVGKCRKNLRSLPIQTSLWVSLDRISCSSVHCLLVVYDVGDFLF